MTTQTALKARIADDIDRSDVSTQIGEAIGDAIKYYQCERFYFNETRSETFNTVASQRIYTVADDAAIPKFINFDNVWVTVGGRVYSLAERDVSEIEYLADNSASSGQPYFFAYYDQSIHLYPIPDQAYQIRMQGHIEKDAPASDGEANNVWMTEAFELIRCKAKSYLHMHVLKDREEAAFMENKADEAKKDLDVLTAKKVGAGRIVPTQF